MSESSKPRRILIPSLSLAQHAQEFPITLPEEFSKHVGRVLRMKEGELLEVCDGEACRWLTRIVQSDHDAVVCVFVERLPDAPRPFPIYLAQAMPKADKFEMILKHGTEIGISGFFPFFSERCVVKLKPNKVAQKMARWEKIVREAARQCQRADIPTLCEPATSKSLGAVLPQDAVRVVCWEGATSLDLKGWLSQLQPGTFQAVVVVIGPEGGFSTEEAELLAQDGALVGLGPLILRTETAGLATAATLQFALGCFGGEHEGALFCSNE